MQQATVRQCAVLVGGLGTRLGALAATTPKPLLPCGGRPFLFWLLRELQRFGVEEFVLLAGHLADEVRRSVDSLAAALPKPARFLVSEEPVRAGTGGALRFAAPLLAPRFLVCNGDSLVDANLAPLLAAAAADPPEVTGRLLLRRVPDASRYGVVTLDGDRVLAFRPRPEPGRPGLINAGLYLLDRRIVESLSPVCSLEADVLPRLAEAGQLRGTRAEGWFIDIGIPADLARADREIAARLRRPALFLDRDGVLNQDHGHVGTRERWEWMPGAREAVRMATDRGWHVFVVTNQSGVARGFYDENAVQSLHGWMADELRRAGGTVDDLRYCPFHPAGSVAAYRRASDWRKPAPGMILDLLRAWKLDPARAVLVGDQPTDLAAAAAAGVRGIAFAGGDLAETVRPLLG